MTMETRPISLSRYWPRRYSVVFLSAVAIFICYIDRANISVTILPMAAEYGWDDRTQGFVLSSFFLGYLVTQILGGWLANRYGGKAILALGVIVWSIFTIITPPAAALGLTILYLARIGMGIGEGVAFPSVYNLFGKWVPEEERSRAIGIVFSGIPLGTVFALVASPIIAEAFGWEWVFYLFGATGFIWWIFWDRLVAHSPQSHQRIASFERERIVNSGAAVGEAAATPWRELLTSLPVWAIIVSHFCTNWASYVLLSFLPKYLVEGLGVDFAAVGLFAMLPALVSFLALNFVGVVADRAIARGVPKIRVRKFCQFLAFGGAAAALIAVGGVSSAPVAIAIMCVGNFLGGFAAGGFAVNHLDIAPRHAGVLMGLTNTAGTLPGFIGVLVSGLILQATGGNWAVVFQVAAAICLFGLVFYLLFAKADKLFD